MNEYYLLYLFLLFVFTRSGTPIIIINPSKKNNKSKRLTRDGQAPGFYPGGLGLDQIKT